MGARDELALRQLYRSWRDAQCRADRVRCEIGPFLRRVRTDRGLSLREVSRRAGVDPSNLSHTERGIWRMSTASLNNVLGVLGLEVTP